ncbi:MAG: hypothetical protein JWO66_109 [Candidatus Eremiobacteraeota bacterium]|nr:hypothetical protein [Candidatus Eremiobacteraeota bacterium]
MSEVSQPNDGKSVISTIRDVLVIIAAYLFFIGFVYRDSYLAFAGVRSLQVDTPIQFFPAYAYTVFTSRAVVNEFSAMPWFALLLVLIGVSLAGGVLRMRHRSQTIAPNASDNALANRGDSNRAAYRAAAFVLSFVIAVAVLRVSAQLAVDAGKYDGAAEKYNKSYITFTFSEQGQPRADPTLLAFNKQHILRLILQNKDLFLVGVTAAPGAEFCSSIYFIERNSVRTAHLEQLGPAEDLTSDGLTLDTDQRWVTCQQRAALEHCRPAPLLSQ